jgi:hypothetical protein
MENTTIQLGWFLGACVAAVGAMLAWWGNNRYFSGRFDQWQMEVKERFDRFHERIEGIEELKQRVKTLEAEVLRTRDLRHDVIGMTSAFRAMVDLVKHKL